ncbi:MULTISPECIES: hypothetical protein [Burkholderia]|uniref:hypothetical protein n=1 Tax=Burkholderia TaxID=32008 RepID=UPI00158D6BA5|nr:MULTISPECIES: hypothetical protein [Burkholderia]MBY4868539.1 hypothetical protein [Burkholderia anthina]
MKPPSTPADADLAAVIGEHSRHDIYVPRTAIEMRQPIRMRQAMPVHFARGLTQLKQIRGFVRCNSGARKALQSRCGAG